MNASWSKGASALTILLTLPLARPALAADPSKPVVAVLEVRGSQPIDHELATILEGRIEAMHRFSVASGRQVRKALGSSSISEAQYSQPKALARSTGARILLIPEVKGDQNWRQSHEVETVHRHREGPDKIEVVKTKREQVDFTASVEAAIRIYDERTGLDVRVPFGALTTSQSSNRQAEHEALRTMADSLALHLRELYPLHTRIIGREGRVVTLDSGYLQGMHTNYYFHLATSPDVLVHVDEVEASRSTGRIVDGYYAASIGQRLIEDPQPDLSSNIALGYVNRVTFSGKSLQTTLNALELHLNNSGADGADLVFDIGSLSDITGIGALSLGLHMDPQLELLPEILWLDGSLGGEANIFYLKAAGANLSAQSLHLIGSVGARLALPLGFKLSANVGWMTPWTVSTWHDDLSNGSSSPATGSLPSFGLGGPFVQGSLVWAF